MSQAAWEALQLPTGLGLSQGWSGTGAAVENIWFLRVSPGQGGFSMVSGQLLQCQSSEGLCESSGCPHTALHLSWHLGRRCFLLSLLSTGQVLQHLTSALPCGAPCKGGRNSREKNQLGTQSRAQVWCHSMARAKATWKADKYTLERWELSEAAQGLLPSRGRVCVWRNRKYLGVMNPQSHRTAGKVQGRG